MKNLDLLAAKAAQEIIKQSKGQEQKADNVENLITKTLGVLQENGVYAAMLYLYSRSNKTDKPIAERICIQLRSLLPTELGLSLPGDDASTVLKFLTDKICNELDTLLLVKQLWEQTLIYARYGAKAWGVEAKVEADKNKASQEQQRV